MYQVSVKALCSFNAKLLDCDHLVARRTRRLTANRIDCLSSFRGPPAIVRSPDGLKCDARGSPSQMCAQPVRIQACARML
jgi:hypothetical protein